MINGQFCCWSVVLISSSGVSWVTIQHTTSSEWSMWCATVATHEHWLSSRQSGTTRFDAKLQSTSILCSTYFFANHWCFSDWIVSLNMFNPLKTLYIVNIHPNLTLNRRLLIRILTSTGFRNNSLETVGNASGCIFLLAGQLCCRCFITVEVT